MSDHSTKIQEIAFHLGHPWKYNHLAEPCDWRFEIIDGCGRRLSVRIEKDKFRITGTFPHHNIRVPNEKYTAIGASISRPAKAIAADIKRRLLPEYLENFETAADIRTKADQRERDKKLIIQALVTVTGGYFAEHSQRVHFIGGDAHIHYGGEQITLTLRDLSPDDAVTIAASITAANAEQEKTPC